MAASAAEATVYADIPCKESDQQDVTRAVSTPSHEQDCYKRRKKVLYFEFAKQKWENEEAFRLPDGTFWPQVEEGDSQSYDHGTVICKLCSSNAKDNNFTGTGYRKGKRSALVDHAQKNKQHVKLVAQMEKSLRKITLLGGQAHRLANKVAIVTGAGGCSGIGFACAMVLGQEGAQVVVTDDHEPRATQSAQRLRLEGCRASAFKCNLALWEECDSLVAAVVQTFHCVDILVSCGDVLWSPSFLATTHSNWDHVIASNLKSAFLCGQSVGGQMIRQAQAETGSTGAIVNVSAVQSIAGIFEETSFQAADKGIESLTRSMALHLAPHGVRVNAVGPSAIAGRYQVDNSCAETHANTIRTSTPLKRLGDPLEIAQVVAFLVSEAASYMTGQTLHVDGGRTALSSAADDGQVQQMPWQQPAAADASVGVTTTFSQPDVAQISHVPNTPSKVPDACVSVSLAEA